MDFQELIPEEKILLIEEPEEDKFQLMKQVLDQCASTDGLKHTDKIWDTLLERENSMSTGIGLGVAIPHCSTEHVTDVHAMLTLLKKGIDFQAVDDVPVRIIVLLLMPKNKFEKHIKTLASIARLFNNESFREKILMADSPAEALNLLQNEAPTLG